MRGTSVSSLEPYRAKNSSNRHDRVVTNASLASACYLDHAQPGSRCDKAASINAEPPSKHECDHVQSQLQCEARSSNEGAINPRTFYFVSSDGIITICACTIRWKPITVKRSSTRVTLSFKVYLSTCKPRHGMLTIAANQDQSIHACQL